MVFFKLLHASILTMTSLLVILTIYSFVLTTLPESLPFLWIYKWQIVAHNATLQREVLNHVLGLHNGFLA